MASIVKELDKVSGTTTRSHNIADAVSKLKMGGGDAKVVVEQTSEGTYTSSMSYDELTNYIREHNSFPVCYYLANHFDIPIPYFYAGKYSSSAPPYADGYMFVGLIVSEGRASLQSVIIKTNDTVEIGTVSMATE